MSDGTTRSYLSIGEVLGILLEAFPEVTISKIRFLESQGLIDPERTSSGYRKFSASDVDRLRFIMREQKDNYLPLKVIKDRLANGEGTSQASPRPMPSGASWATVPSAGEASSSTGDRENSSHLVVATVEIDEVIAIAETDPAPGPGADAEP